MIAPIPSAAATSAPNTLIATVWTDVTHPQGRRVAITRAEVVERFGVPAITLDKKLLAGWAPTSFRRDYRNLENVEASYAIGFDLDGDGTNLDCDAEALSDLAGLIYTSYRHTPARHRGRAIVWTSRPVLPGEYRACWHFVARRLPTVGQAAKDPSRLWFVPGIAPGGEYRLVELKGEPLDVEAALAADPLTRQRLPRGPAEAAVSRWGAPVEAKTRAGAYLAAAVEREATILAQTPEGARHTRLYESLCRLLPLARGVDADASRATDPLSSAALEAGLPEREVESTLRSALAWVERSGAVRIPELHEAPNRLVYVANVYVEARAAWDDRPPWGVVKFTAANADGSPVLPRRAHVVLPLPGYERARPRYDSIVGAEIDPWDLHRRQGPLARELLIGRELRAVIRGGAMPVAERTGRSMRDESESMLVTLADEALATKVREYLRTWPNGVFAAHARLVEIIRQRKGAP